MTDLDLAGAQRRESELNAQYRNTENEIAVLQRKIDRLKAAKNKIGAIKKDAEELKNDASKKNATKKLGLSWKGDNYDRYVDYIDGSLKTTFKNYVNGIDGCQDSIVDKINEYQKMIIKKRTILSDLWSTISDLSAWIEKTFN